jgi:hypothetical protein
MELSLLTGVKIFLTLYDDQVPNSANIAVLPEGATQLSDAAPPLVGAKLI